MIELPRRLRIEDLERLEARSSIGWTTARGGRWAQARLPLLPLGEITSEVAPAVETVVVIGGGTLIDSAKVRARALPNVRRLYAVPTIWGSGAEVSRIAVYSVDGARHIDIDDVLVPDGVVYVYDFAATIPPERALDACGDSWAHALEGFASPLATPELRSDLAAVIREMAGMELGTDPHWFDVSAVACAGQSHSSVGLVHGLAHVLEGALDDPAFHHARLCRVMLAPVLMLNRRAQKWRDLFEQHAIDLDMVEKIAEQLFDATEFSRLAAVLTDNWPAVLRDPSTRTNAVLVRKADLDVLTDRVSA
jgi:alcohol dehydrogenase class IV